MTSYKSLRWQNNEYDYIMAPHALINKDRSLSYIDPSDYP